MCPRVQKSKSLSFKDSKNSRIQEFKTPRIQESKDSRIQESNGPNIQKSKIPRFWEFTLPKVDESNNPKASEFNSPRVQDSKCLRVQKSESSSVQESNSSRDHVDSIKFRNLREIISIQSVTTLFRFPKSGTLFSLDILRTDSNFLVQFRSPSSVVSIHHTHKTFPGVRFQPASIASKSRRDDKKMHSPQSPPLLAVRDSIDDLIGSILSGPRARPYNMRWGHDGDDALKRISKIENWLLKFPFAIGCCYGCRRRSTFEFSSPLLFFFALHVWSGVLPDGFADLGCAFPLGAQTGGKKG